MSFSVSFSLGSGSSGGVGVGGRSSELNTSNDMGTEEGDEGITDFLLGIQDEVEAEEEALHEVNTTNSNHKKMETNNLKTNKTKKIVKKVLAEEEPVECMKHVMHHLNSLH